MKFPKELTTATPLSKYLAMVVFVSLPIVGFFFGMRYQEMVDLTKRQEMEENLSIPRTLTPTPIAIPTTDPSITANWKTYINSKYGSIYKFSIKHPADWRPRGHDSGTSFDLDLLSPDYQAPTTGTNEAVLQGARINISVIQKDKKYSTLEDWFKNYFYDPRTRNVLYVAKEVTIHIVTLGNTQGLSYETKGLDGNVHSKLFSLNNTIYQFTLTSKEDSAQYIPIFDQILATFKFTKDNQDQAVCTQDVKLCLDGKTYVSRQPPNCEFASCPK